MAKQINVSVGGVVKKVKEVPLGIGGVVKKAKSGKCGVGGVVKEFFTSELVLYDAGTSDYGVVGSSCTLGDSYMTLNSVDAYFYFKTPIDMSGYTKVNVTFVDNQMAYPNGIWYLHDRNFSTTYSTGKCFDEEGWTREPGAEKTVSCNYTSMKNSDNVVNLSSVILMMGARAWNSSWSTGYSLSGLKIKKVWLS